MMRLPRFLPYIAIACVGVVSVPAVFLQATWAQEAPAVQPAGNEALRQSADDFWHYAKIGRYDLANTEAKKILADKDQPVQVLEAFEAVAAEREAAAVDPQGSLDQWLLRWQGVQPMRDVATQLINVLGDGYRTRRSDPNFIESNIKRLIVNERAYSLSIARLRESGELSVPLMLDYLCDPARNEYHPAIRRALKDLGRLALNPLVAATEMKDNDVLVMVCQALGDIGYNAPVPYLARLANDRDTNPAVRTAATQALMRMGAGQAQSLNAASLFYALAEKFYYNTADIAAEGRNPVAYVWLWDTQKGLIKKDVAPAIFPDLMAMRACEYCLKLDANNPAAVSLWLAADYKREADLPEGAKDPTRPEGQPNAHYYGVSAGTQYLNPVLARALQDHNSAVALRAIKSLQQIVGQNNMLSGNVGDPIVQALRSPERTVRFEAAFAVAAALPQQPFVGKDAVVPVLAEAVAQNGQGNILVVTADANEVNSLVQGLKDSGYGAAGAAGVDAAVASAAMLPAVDVILVSDALPVSQIDRLFLLAGQSPRLAAAARVVMSKTPQVSPFAGRTMNDRQLSVIAAAAKAADLKQPIEEARQRSGSQPLDEKRATEYALRALDVLGQLALNRSPVLDVSAAEPTLLGALDDARPEIIQASAKVLGLLNTRQAQAALLATSSDQKTADDVKISLYNGLAANAKLFGSTLDADQVQLLQKAAQGEKNLLVRSAAAEACGALNLPAEQAKSLIANQSVVGK